VLDRGFFITLQAIRRQLMAMPCDLYLIRLIHHPTRRAFPGERLWTATQLMRSSVVRFLRLRNREGCDVYIQPYADGYNAGYILLDLDHASPQVVESMHAQGHQPCVLLRTSPSHLQAWIHVSLVPLLPAQATAIAQELAWTYGGDRASTDWRHLGRLAGFTNQKPQRRISGYAPWVKILHAQPGLASQSQPLLERATSGFASVQAVEGGPSIPRRPPTIPTLTRAGAASVYQRWIERWQIQQRFPHPDWSIVDLWVARKLLRQGIPPEQVEAVLRLGSPQFPRHHGDAQDYLQRTLLRAASSIPSRPVCSPPAKGQPIP
jgi:hypothetical protein